MLMFYIAIKLVPRYTFLPVQKFRHENELLVFVDNTEAFLHFLLSSLKQQDQASHILQLLFCDQSS
jgi:hypothetical protein